MNVKEKNDRKQNNEAQHRQKYDKSQCILYSYSRRINNLLIDRIVTIGTSNILCRKKQACKPHTKS